MIILRIVLLILIVAYVYLLIKSRLKPAVVRTAAIVIFVAGTVLNMVGLAMEPYTDGWAARLARSILMTVQMFLYHFEIFEMPKAQLTPGFLDLYFFFVAGAMITSASAIILLFGKRARTWLILALRRRKFRHVFIGVNSRSVVVAKGIKDEDTAFIEFPSDNEDEKFSVAGVLRGMTGDSGKLNLSSKGNVVSLRAKSKLAPGDAGGNIFATIGLDNLKRLVDADTAFYILSEDAMRNLDDLMALLGDEDLEHNTIHVCLSREGVSRYYKTTMKQTGVHFIYPSSLSVVELMKSPACHPANVMTPVLTEDGKPTGAVEGGFNALVIGFGETGQAVAKFLYEFCAAVGSDGKPIPTSIIINDERMERLRGPFRFDNPAMGNSPVVMYENLGTESSEFWQKIMERLDNLNYISISMKDDASNLEIACAILMYALKKRKNGVENFRIVVRKRVTLSHERRLVDRMNEKVGKEVIICYGEQEKVFTPEMIVAGNRSGINRSATSLAETIAEAYRNVSGRTISIHGQTKTYHEKSRQRMEMHQLISRANHVASLEMLLGGNPCKDQDASAELIENLAVAEHLRYARYLAAHGYSFADEDDDAFKTNHQICSWDELKEEDRQYHRDMAKAKLTVL